MKASEAFLAGIVGGVLGSLLTVLTIRKYRKWEKECQSGLEIPDDWAREACLYDDTDEEPDSEYMCRDIPDDWMTGEKDDGHTDSEDEYDKR